MNNSSILQSFNSSIFLLMCSLLLGLTSCSKDNEPPHIDSVWLNMVSQPIEQTSFAYPGQTLCIHGSGLAELRHLIVNGTHIDLNAIFVYVADNAITFQLPSDVNTVGDYIRVVTAYGQVDFPFIVRPASEQSTFYYKDSDTPFSSTTLVPGNTLSIRGTNLTGVKEVWLPLAFDGRIACEFDPTKTNTDDYVYVVIPEATNFATGRCEMVIEKYDETRDITYTEKIYSKTTDFIN